MFEAVRKELGKREMEHLDRIETRFEQSGFEVDKHSIPAIAFHILEIMRGMREAAKAEGREEGRTRTEVERVAQAVANEVIHRHMEKMFGKSVKDAFYSCDVRQMLEAKGGVNHVLHTLDLMDKQLERIGESMAQKMARGLEAKDDLPLIQSRWITYVDEHHRILRKATNALAKANPPKPLKK